MTLRTTIASVIARLLGDAMAPTRATMPDVPITCVMCRRAFVWGASEQRRFALKAWAPPIRCEQCRAWRLLPRRSRGLPPGTRPHDILSCQSCGKSFTVSRNMRARLAAEGRRLPQRCSWCRQSKPARDNRKALVSDLEGWHTEMFLSGDPLSTVVSDALVAGDVNLLVRAHAIVVGAKRRAGG